MTHRLEADSIQLEFGSRRVLSDIYLKCETGKITGLLGRNGEGKTCLMNVLYGSLEALSKSVRFDQVTVFHAFKRSDLLLYLPQFNFIPNGLTIQRVFSDYGLPYSDFEHHFPEFKSKQYTAIQHLSGGLRRLIEVYIVIMKPSQFTMLDEPFSHLMPLHIEKIKELLFAAKIKKGLLVTDHMYPHIMDISDDLYVLTNGKVHLVKGNKDIEALGYIRASR